MCAEHAFTWRGHRWATGGAVAASRTTLSASERPKTICSLLQFTAGNGLGGAQGSLAGYIGTLASR